MIVVAKKPHSHAKIFEVNRVWTEKNFTYLKIQYMENQWQFESMTIWVLEMYVKIHLRNISDFEMLAKRPKTFDKTFGQQFLHSNMFHSP